MYDFEIYRRQWMLLGVGTGLILMIMIVLLYLAIWRERGIEKKSEQPITDMKSFFVWFERAFPWVLILTLAGTWALALIYPFIRAANPPNW